MRSRAAVSCLPASVSSLAACASDDTASTSTAPSSSSPGVSAAAWGPETPNFNLEVILRGSGFGHQVPPAERRRGDRVSRYAGAWACTEDRICPAARGGSGRGR